MWLLKPLLLIALTYMATVLAMYAMQTRLLFPAGMAANPNFNLPPGAERLEVFSPDGEKLIGARVPSANNQGEQSPVILGFGGNAWNADDLAVFLHGLFPDAEIFSFHYRGYRPSTGTPSAANLLADAPVIFDHIHDGIGDRPIVVAGFSIGTGVAAHLAAQRPIDGMILVSPFDSLEALARDHFWWAPTKWLLRHRMPTLETARDLNTPTAVIAASEDTLISPQRTEAVRQALISLVCDQTIPNTGHNDVYGHPKFAEAMSLALARIGDTWDAGADDAPLKNPIQ